MQTNVFDILIGTPTRYLSIYDACFLSFNPHLKEQMLTKDLVRAQGYVKSMYKNYEKKYVLYGLSASPTSKIIHFYILTFNTTRARYSLEQWVKCIGKVTVFSNKITFTSPDAFYSSDRYVKYLPVYPEKGKIKSGAIRNLIQRKFQTVDEYLDDSVRERFKLMNINEALYNLHFSQDMSNIEESKRRIQIEEISTHWLAQTYSKESAIYPAHEFSISQEVFDNVCLNASFTPTKDQLQAIEDITGDLKSCVSVNRLLQGDVGCGKTFVILSILAQVSNNRLQSLFVAPTEILAMQHYQTIKKLLPSVDVFLIAGGLGKKILDANKKSILQSPSAIIIGTHALLSDSFECLEVGMVVVDEQHRFGVQQRSSLIKKGSRELFPHVLSVTATPIPRTLLLTAYNYISVSTIRHKPQGRKEIVTGVVNQDRRSRIFDRLLDFLSAGRQVYWVCPAIKSYKTKKSEAQSADSSEEEMLRDYKRKGVEEIYQEISEHFLNYKVAFLHGKMLAKERTQIIDGFKKNTIQILVATTIIEVGIDIPNASVMIIESADCLGLAQLHQLRGRIGRGTHNSYCVLLYTDPCSEEAQQRLKILVDSTDGFVIAQKDLELRGPGNILGLEQSGKISFKFTKAHEAESLMEISRNVAAYVMKQSNPSNIESLIQRWRVIK